jgi:hypothetical protein
MSDGPDSAGPESVSTESASPEPGNAVTEPADAAAGDQEGTEADRWSRLLPGWVRRRPLAAGVGAGVLAAAVIAAVVLLLLRPSAPQPQYASLPGQSCALVSPADVAKYLPGAKGTPQSSGSSSAVKISICKWSATTGVEDRTLVAEAVIFRSGSSVTQARQDYGSTISSLRCRCPGVTVSAKPVADLGDQATEAFVVAAPDANFNRAPNAADPGASLVVLSSNAVISVYLDTTVTATGQSQTSPPGSAQLAAMISMARDALATLARPASAPVPGATALAAEPHYAGGRDPCRLISPATLARYMPGSALSPLPGTAANPGTGQASACAWNSDDYVALLNLSTYPDAVTAGQRFQELAGGTGQAGGTDPVTGMRYLSDLGEAALATFHDQGGKASVDVLVWSGNDGLDYTYTDQRAGSASRADRARLLTAAIAMARDGLAALADPAASAFPTGTIYSAPRDSCQLVTAPTLARYAAGVTGHQLTSSGQPALGQSSDQTCAWNPPDGSLFLEVTIYTGIDNAQGGYQSGLQFAHQDSGTDFNGSQPVKGLGEQATAIFETETSPSSPQVVLEMWSGNAVIDMTFDSLPPVLAPPPTRAVMLATDIAMARDALAHLRHT